MMRSCCFIVVLGLLPLAACAQTAPPATPTAAPPAGVATAPTTGSAKAPGAVAANGVKPSTPPDGATEARDAYVYEGVGRRDPFTNLLNNGAVDPRDTSRRVEGTAGLMVNEIVVRAVVENGAKTVAMIQGPDGRNYNVHSGDKLMDGTVKSITPQGLIIMQEVNDPLSTAKQREVRKLLRSLEEAKQ